VRKNILFGAIGGLAIGLLVAFLIEYLDYSIRAPEDVETVTGQVPLAVIGLVSRKEQQKSERRAAEGSAQVSSDLFIMQNPRAPVSEAFRALRTNLAFSGLNHAIRGLVITSISPSEGKSTVAANLAVVMAQSGKQVILVDADLRRPSVHKMFGLHNVGGLTDILLTQGDLLTGLQSSVVPNLQVLTSGPLPPNPAELLSSERIKTLIDALQQSADIVIFDTPPMGALTDAVVLAAQVDATLLVVRAGSTRPNVVAKGLETLRKVGARPLGVVLNMVDVGSLRDYSYYYYYAQSGNYLASAEQARVASSSK
jgi:capsular exopolysaccharide synthesis family protein